MDREPEFQKDATVTYISASFGEIPGRVVNVYIPEDKEKNVMYSVLLAADKCPKEFQPDRIVPTLAENLRLRETARTQKKATKKTAKPAGNSPEEEAESSVSDERMPTFSSAESN